MKDAELSKQQEDIGVEESNQPESSMLWRNICRWLEEIQISVVTGATTEKSKQTTGVITNLECTAQDYHIRNNFNEIVRQMSAARPTA